MRGKLRLQILQAIARGYDTAIKLGEFLKLEPGSMFDRGASLAQRLRHNDRVRARKEVRAIDRERYFEKLSEIKKKQRQLANSLYELKKNGFIIERANEDKKTRLVFSGKGEKLKKVLEQKEKFAPPDTRRYKSAVDAVTKIISFDIPEKIAWKRRWLRSALKHLGFKMVHQSFWLGAVALPTDFLTDLVEMKIFEHLEIFAISKRGTLKKL